VIANLLDNSIKYTGRGGHVVITASKDDRHARVIVSDTGVGIEPVHLDRIWQRPYRADQSRSRHGLGLGLSFVKAIVEAHHGMVIASSLPGRGATFTMSISLREPGPRSA